MSGGIGGGGGLGGIPEGSVYEKPAGKATPMHRHSMASKTLYEPTSPPGLSRKKSIFPWAKKKQQEQEAMEFERQNMIMREQERQREEKEERRRLERLLEEERAKREQFEAEQRLKQHQEEERRRAKADERRKKDQERQAHEERRRREVDLRRKTNTPEALRNLRELIRTRYELDMEIYRLKDVRGPDRPFVEKKMQRSDAVLAEIWAIVSTWEDNPEIWHKKEWELAVEVRERLFAEGKRLWVNNPPWNDD
jgi:hypothetical protein